MPGHNPNPFMVTLSSQLKPTVPSFTPTSRDVKIGRSQRPGRMDIVVRAQRHPGGQRQPATWARALRAAPLHSPLLPLPP